MPVRWPLRWRLVLGIFSCLCQICFMSSSIVFPQESRNPKGNNPNPEDAEKAILVAFDKYEIVGLASPAHGNKDLDDFILTLLRNPAFPDKVNDIAAECGNSLYQPILDRYIAGDDVPLSEVRPVWRNTTQAACGVSAFYEELFPLVRRINQKLPIGKRLRVLACDPPVDWNKVKSYEEMWSLLRGRDESIAFVVEKEVLAKHRKALMLFGLPHIVHEGGAVGMYEQKGYSDLTFIIATHNGFGPVGNDTPLAKDNDDLEKRLASWPVPSLIPVRGTWLSDLDYAYVDGGETGKNRMSAKVDGYLYLGPRALILREVVPAGIVLDRDYVAELRRRSDSIGGGIGGRMRPEIFFPDPSESNVFLYDPVANKGRPENTEKQGSTR